MAEGARLESVYAGNRIEGSNPSLSAIILNIFPYLQWTTVSLVPPVTTAVTTRL